MLNEEDGPVVAFADLDKKMRFLMRKLFPDGMKPCEIELFFSQHAINEDKKVFVDFVTTFLKVGRGDLSFALEQASKCTKEVMLKNFLKLT